MKQPIPIAEILNSTGSWEKRERELMKAGKYHREQRLEEIEHKFELESDEFYTAREKAIQIQKREEA